MIHNDCIILTEGIGIVSFSWVNLCLTLWNSIPEVWANHMRNKKQPRFIHVFGHISTPVSFCGSAGALRGLRMHFAE